MPVIDFHSHILPGIDDGSRNIETTRGMLDLMKEQGVEWAVATPHFYASRDRMESFLARRKQAYETVCEGLPQEAPRILLGAEVAFFPGISRADKLGLLAVGDTGVLLLEMPFAPWENSYIEEVKYLSEKRKFTVLLAHLERYMNIPGNRKRIQELLELPVKVQINAQSLTEWKSRGRLVRMFRDGQAHFLGSDCHGLHRRPPNLPLGREALGQKLGLEFVDEMDEAGARLLRI